VKALVTATFYAGELERLAKRMDVAHEDWRKTQKVYFSSDELIGARTYARRRRARRRASRLRRDSRAELPTNATYKVDKAELRRAFVAPQRRN
jgi:hypothetical protein